MTLEKRLQLRLQSWLADARRRRLAQSEGTPGESGDDEWWLNQSALESLEKCINELAADLAARNDAEPNARSLAQISRAPKPSPAWEGTDK